MLVKLAEKHRKQTKQAIKTLESTLAYWVAAYSTHTAQFYALYGEYIGELKNRLSSPVELNEESLTRFYEYDQAFTERLASLAVTASGGRLTEDQVRARFGTERAKQEYEAGREALRKIDAATEEALNKLRDRAES
jgi:hypothetical protein